MKRSCAGFVRVCAAWPPGAGRRCIGRERTITKETQPFQPKEPHDTKRKNRAAASGHPPGTQPTPAGWPKRPAIGRLAQRVAGGPGGDGVRISWKTHCRMQSERKAPAAMGKARLPPRSEPMEGAEALGRAAGAKSSVKPSEVNCGKLHLIAPKNFPASWTYFQTIIGITTTLGHPNRRGIGGGDIGWRRPRCRT